MKLYRFQVYSSTIHHLCVVFCVFTTPSQVSGWKLFLKRVEKKIFICCQERPNEGEAWRRENEGMINRVRVSGGGGRDQMEGLALTWGEVYSETGEEDRRRELESFVFRNSGSANQMSLISRGLLKVKVLRV